MGEKHLDRSSYGAKVPSWIMSRGGRHRLGFTRVKNNFLPPTIITSLNELIQKKKKEGKKKRKNRSEETEIPA